jgi:hypothetical protein
MGEIVFNYLLHHSYFDTAAVVARDLLDGAAVVSPKDVEDVKHRRGVAEAVVAGRIDEAMAAAEALAPGVLAAHPNILFRLHCQKFIELVGVTARTDRPDAPDPAAYDMLLRPNHAASLACGCQTYRGALSVALLDGFGAGAQSCAY